MRLRKVKNIEEKIKECSDVIVFDAKEQFGKWHEKFNNNNPIYLEIGTGKGKFIMEHARRNPDINYIGCELETSVIYKAALKLKDASLSNLYFINCDAISLKEIFAKGEITKLFLNFSDPWPKSRHEKRRLTSESFINVYKEILIDNGEIEFKTDNLKLFEYSVISLNNNNSIFLDISLSLHERDLDIITTEYEDKFRKLGQPIYYIKVRIK